MLTARRLAVAATGAALVFVMSYAAQRLWAASGPPIDPRQIVAEAHIPYFDRLRLAAAHAATAGALLVFGGPTGGSAARWLPFAVVGVALFGVVVALAVP